MLNFFQELVDMKMNCKQLESKLKKLSSSSTMSVGHGAGSNFKQQDKMVENIFDEDFSRKKSGLNQPPPLNPSKSKKLRFLIGTLPFTAK